MKRDLRDYESVSDFLEAVRADKDALRALDEAALSGELAQLQKVREAISALRSHQLPTA
ncbi:MAG TPA: hypothetical protein VFX59_17190 [Polyangiales bacterium]|nr:hypothetical protein [Polyangiales bacterium]